MGNPLLLAAAVICAVASYGVDRFGYEVCHRGLPLGFLMVALPAAGIACAIVAMLARRKRATVALGAAMMLVNGYYAVLALAALGTVGVMSCG
jgi:hypothetical protein